MADNGGGRLYGRMEIQFRHQITSLNVVYIKTSGSKCQVPMASQVLGGNLVMAQCETAGRIRL